MNQSALSRFGWRAGRAETKASAVLLLLMAISLAGLIAAAFIEQSVLPALLNRLNAVHMALGASLTAAAFYAGVILFSGAAGMVLALAEAASGFALGGAMMGVLPFAQASDPSAAKHDESVQKSIARPEMQVGLYAGKSSSPPSDVHFKSPDGTDMTLTDVVWRPDSFKPSPFYGGRGIDWNARAPRFGMMVDFTHAKATATRTQTVTHHGKHKGIDVPPSGPITDIFRKLEFTHGLNFLTFNGIYRATGLHRRIVPYAGLGVGFMVPHVNVRRAGQEKKDEFHEAQITGIAMQAFGGIEWRVFKSDRRSLFTEYKLTSTSNFVRLHDGGSVETDILVHQFNFGVYFTPWRAGDAAAR